MKLEMEVQLVHRHLKFKYVQLIVVVSGVIGQIVVKIQLLKQEILVVYMKLEMEVQLVHRHLKFKYVQLIVVVIGVIGQIVVEI
jgi:hypothetical protein